MKHLFDQIGDGRGQKWSLKVSFTNECLAGAHPLPVEDSQPAQPQLHDCLHLLHQVWEGAVQAWGSLVVRSLSSSPGKMLRLSRCCQGTLCLVPGLWPWGPCSLFAAMDEGAEELPCWLWPQMSVQLI